MRQRPALLAVLLLAACARRPAPAPIATGDALVRAMHDRYAGTWYRTLVFQQRTTVVLPNGTEQVQTWFEAASLPRRLRIEFGPHAEGNGGLYRGDTLYRFTGGRRVSAARQPNELLILGFDIYHVPPAEMAAQLRSLGFDLDRVRETTWQGRPAYVVGDTVPRHNAFWVDRERLVFVRMTRPAGRDSSGVSDFRFNDYRPLGGGWIAAEVEQLLNGRRRFHEAYSNIQADVPLDPALFDPARWTTARTPW